MMKKILMLALAALLVLGTTVSAALGEEEAEARECYVYTENHQPLSVRTEPQGQIVGRLEYGEKVKVLSVVGDRWAEIIFHYNHPQNGEGDWTAYVNWRYLSDIAPEEIDALLESEKEAYTGDPMTDINAEFATAAEVTPYRVTARPARVTSWVSMRWIPSETGMEIARYTTTEELIVLKETAHYLQVQDPDTGDVGYIHKRFAQK